jgi:hypothetical protein
MMTEEDRRRVALLSALGKERMAWLRGLRSKHDRERFTVVDGGRRLKVGSPKPPMRGKLTVVPRWQPATD